MGVTVAAEGGNIKCGEAKEWVTSIVVKHLRARQRVGDGVGEGCWWRGRQGMR